MFAVFEYRYPERFVVGTVGLPGHRTFFLQARDGARVTSVTLEKQQVAVLAERLDDLLDAVLRRSSGQAPIPAMAAADALDMEPLDTPVEEQFRVGTMGLGWDDDAEHVVIEAYAVGEGDEGDAGDDQSDVESPDLAEATATEPGVESEDELIEVDESADVLRVLLSGTAARAFARRAESVVAAGRPACPFCTLPLDPEGHICPRQNGYRRRS
jgi:uncharacterized repeat protein (TIGR03847 family)